MKRKMSQSFLFYSCFFFFFASTSRSFLNVSSVCFFFVFIVWMYVLTMPWPNLVRFLIFLIFNFVLNSSRIAALYGFAIECDFRVNGSIAVVWLLAIEFHRFDRMSANARIRFDCWRNIRNILIYFLNNSGSFLHSDVCYTRATIISV